MNLSDLNEDQKLQLKMNILVERDDVVHYSDLANADELVSDELLEEKCGGTEFVEEDFV